MATICQGLLLFVASAYAGEVSLQEALASTRHLLGLDVVLKQPDAVTMGGGSIGVREQFDEKVLRGLFHRSDLNIRPAYQKRVAAARQWLVSRRNELARILHNCELLDTEFNRLARSSDAPAVPAMLHSPGPAQQGLAGHDLISACLAKASDTRASADQRITWFHEALGAWRRYYGVLRWLDMSLLWTDAEIARSLDFLIAMPQIKVPHYHMDEKQNAMAIDDGIMLNLPGHFSLFLRIGDWAAIDRAMAELLMTDGKSLALLGVAAPGDDPVLRNLPAQARSAGRELLKSWNQSPATQQLFREALASPVELASLAQTLSGYSRAKVIDKLPAVGKAWLWAHPELGNSRLTPEESDALRQELMEVLSDRQGTMQQKLAPERRFWTLLWVEHSKSVAGGPDSRLATYDAALRGTPQAVEELGKMSPKRLKELFGQENVDCFRNCDVAGCRLANLGFGGVYPLMRFLLKLDGASARHNTLVFRPPGQRGMKHDEPANGLAAAQAFPSTSLGQTIEKDGCVYSERYVRTLASWVAADIIRWDGTVEEVPLPQYGRVGRQYKLPEDEQIEIIERVR
jgi:hypothetical protein